MNESSGLSDLLPFLGDRPALTLVAIKAPVGLVTGALVDTYGPHVVEDAATRSARDEPLHVLDWVAVVKMRDEAWTLIYRAFEPLDPTEWDEMVRDGTDLVATLGTRAVILALGGGEVPDRAVVLDGAEIDPGADVDPLPVAIEERAIWRDGVFEELVSSRRDDLAAGDAVPEDFADRLLRDLGIWAPPCWPRQRGDEAWLDLAEVDPARIERVDLLDLGQRAAYDEETLELARENLANDLRDVVSAAAEEASDDASHAVEHDESESTDAARAADSDELSTDAPAATAPADDEASTDASGPAAAPATEPGWRSFFARLVGRG